MLLFVLCFNSKCVYLLNAIAGSVSLETGSEHVWANLYKTNMAADETCVSYSPRSCRRTGVGMIDVINCDWTQFYTYHCALKLHFCEQNGRCPRRMKYNTLFSLVSLFATRTPPVKPPESIRYIAFTGTTYH